MNFIKTKFLNLFILVLALIFLCSCYDIINVKQQKDEYANNTITPVVYLNVYQAHDKALTPYFGMVVPLGWTVNDNIVYTRTYNNISSKIGTMSFDEELKQKMEILDPAPDGYTWWVGTGSTMISKNGIYRAYPKIKTGAHTGIYSIDYMAGDSWNGLNIQRSNDHKLRMVNEETVIGLTAITEGNSIQIKWKPISSDIQIMGYYLFRNGNKVSEAVISDNFYTDDKPPAGSHKYIVTPVYMDGSTGSKSEPASICYASCGTSMRFDSEDASVVIFDDPSLNFSSTFTLEAWFNYESSSASEARIISKGTDGSSYELLLTTSDTDKFIEFHLPVGKLQSSTPIAADTWYHVAAVYTGHEMKIYINGELDCEKYVTGFCEFDSYPLIIGRASHDKTNFAGLIDDVRIWDTHRSADQIKSNFSSDIDNTADHLVGYYNMSEGCSKQTDDASMQKNSGFLAGSCWCPATFPYVESVSSQSNPVLKIPVINYLESENHPEDIYLEFKINPAVFNFEGIISANTMFAAYDYSAIVLPDGTIKIKASKISNILQNPEVLLYLDLKAKIPHVKSSLDFIKCIADEHPNRVKSGDIIVSNPTYKLSSAFPSNAGITNNAVLLYPNPASSCVSIQLEEISDQAELRILNISGKEVLRSTYLENESNTIQKINLSGFSKGIYLINLRTNGKILVSKLAVN